MARNSNTKIIDPMFNIPDEVGDFDYGEDLVDEFDTDEVGTIGEGVEPETFLLDEGDIDYFDAPETPDVLTIVSQVIRTQANGTQVVDLVVDVEDIDGVDTYDFRVVKM